TPDNLDQDFAYVAPPPVLGSIGDTIWCDDGDNTFEAGEGLVGVTVTLSNADGTVDTQATGADGAYLFTELPLGDYTVTVDSASLPDTCNVPSVDPDGGDDNTSDVTLSEEAPDNLDQDFAYVAPTLGSMGDTVWCDDGNGIFDAGEGLVGVSVTLSNADGTVDTQATGADGAYLFTELPLGDYTVTVDLASLPATCNVPSVDPDGGNDSTSNASITEAAPDNLLQDFAYVAPDPTLGSIGDTIWCDDGNGTFEAGEGLTGVSVTLSDATGPITSQVTGADGFYLFQNLALGDYTVTVDLASLPMTCNVPSVDPDGGNDSTSTVTITETAPNNLDQDFAYVAPPLGSIGDTIWCDDGNGTFEAGEGLAGISVTLSNADGTVDTQTTGADGAYLFAELPLGGYTVTVDSTSLPDSCNVPSVDPDGGDDNTSAVTITEAARNNLDQDFAYVAPPPLLGSIGDTIWCDNNGSGAFDAGEGIEGASVTLVGADGTTRTATTDAQGLYLFSELPAGSYTVSIDAVSLPDSCNLPLVDPDGGNDNASTLNLGEDEDNLDQDFGYNPVGCIGDTVWFDQNADGVLDAGENGIGSVNVTLEGADGAVLGSMSTDANGFYQFCDLPAGTYTVNVISGTLPMDLVQTYELDNSLNGSTTAELGPGESRDDVDFGYYEKIDLALTKSVADEEVSIDTTALFSITVVNESDVLATGVTVQDSLPTGLTFSEASASQGTYDSATDIWTIGELSGGQSVFMSILVTVTGEGPYTNTAQVAAAVQEDVDSTPNNNVPGEDDQDDATVRGTATVSVGNYVWLDSDKDGIQDAGETGIAGIGVTLLNGAGTEVGQTTTDENGAYLFTDLPADTYSVRFTLPENYRISPVDAGDNDETDSDVNPDTNSTPGVEVPSGQNLSLDAGIFQLLPNLLLTKTDNSTELQFNNNNAVGSGTIVYSLTYTNAGDLEANNVRIIETVPFSTTFNAALSDDAWDCPDNSVAGTVCTFTVGTLADGQAGAPIIFAVDVIPSELPTGSSQINNTATIDSDSEEPTGRSSSSDSTPVERATPDSLDQEPEPDDGMLRVYIPFMQ
ncbi:MAG: SdrD B-like domain-containing protein, partial [Chloroflexota bacterium]